MSFLLPYKRLNRFIRDETFEPTLNWGLRMGIASVVPIVWGVATDNHEAAKWITLTAESICWVELRGSASLRFRVLVGGAVLALLFAVLGGLTGAYLWLSVLSIFLVGFIAGMFKNLGDRGSGLAICVFVMFIISNAFPTEDAASLGRRCLYIFTGGVWNVLVGMAASSFIGSRQPYRRSIAVIWKAISGLTDTISRGWNGKGARSNLREIYLKEQLVRSAMDTSLHFHERMAYEEVDENSPAYQLAQTRKATSLVAAHVIAVGEEMEQLSFTSMDNSLQLKLYALLKAIQQTSDRLGVYILNLKPEEKLLVQSRIRRLNRLISLMRDYPLKENNAEQTAIPRIILLTERMIRLVETCITRMESIGDEPPVFRSYSLIQTIYVLHPKHLLRNLRLMLNFNSFLVRYALRTAVAAAIGLFIYKYFSIPNGYWLAFTVIFVIQPYFGATLKKAFDRIVGTVLGGIAGGLILRLPAGLHMLEIMLFVVSILMVYFLRKRYAVASFFMTISLVLVFAVDQAFNPNLVWIRTFSTLTGSAIAVICGFALLPAWDRKLLPEYLYQAIRNNYDYFRNAFFPDEKNPNWTRLKRQAETKNSNLFDSFMRYMQEPSIRKKGFTLYYQIITHNVRLTRELNNIHLEEDNKTEETAAPADIAQMEKIRACHYWFNRILKHAGEISHQKAGLQFEETLPDQKLMLTSGQSLYIDRMLVELKTMNEEMEKLLTL